MSADSRIHLHQLTLLSAAARSISLPTGLASHNFSGHTRAFPHRISFRYLHAFPFFVLLNVGALTALIRQRLRQAQSTLPVTPAS